MTVKDATDIAKRWVHETLHGTIGFSGAYLGGSISFLDDNMVFPNGSDIDLRIVMDTRSPEPVHPRQHILYENIILEPSFRDAADLLDADGISKDPCKGCDLWLGKIVYDPTGILSTVHGEVKEKYTRQEYVLARRESLARQFKKATDELLSTSDDDEENGFPRLFLQAVSKLGQVPMVATLANVKLSDVTIGAGAVFAEWGYDGLREEILAAFGCGEFSESTIRIQRQRMIDAFDYANKIIRDRAVAHDFLDPVLRERWLSKVDRMIDSGNSRDAMLCIYTVHSIAASAIRNQGPDHEKNRWRKLYRMTLTDLGLLPIEAVHKKVEKLSNLFVRIHEIAIQKIGTDPRIKR